ncbi:MAG: hypothetical protein NZ561_09775, partial [Phycisphaerae bacterium]|nr:hypothetical protein [Phycisphaerae bacterium]
AAPTTSPSPVEARIGVALLDANEDQLVPSQVFDQGRPLLLPDPAGSRPLLVSAEAKALPAPERWKRVYVLISGNTIGMEYRFTPESVKLLIPSARPGQSPRIILPAANIREWDFRGRFGRVGYQVRGGKPDSQPTHVAVFSFSRAAFTPQSEKVPVEFRGDVERSGVDDSNELPTQLELRVRNRTNGQLSPPAAVVVEANRPTYLMLPAECFAAGEFDILARCTTPGHYLGVTRLSTAVIQENEGFLSNLLKSLLIMWLMAILVIAVSVFCSTFLSWPIAIVLTLVMLLCRWGVIQLGDALQPGIGNQVATDLGFRDPAPSAVVSKSVEALAKFLNTTAGVLPDISQFASIEDLERGVALPARKVGNSLHVLGTFGLPIVVLAYVILRNKEVAP